MGILNLTPDSFSDGGQFNTTDAALAQTERMLTAGANIIDIGGQSTRPGSELLSADEEFSRIEDPLEAIIARFPEAIISIDTFHADVAKKTLERGAHIINDIYAGRFVGERDTQMFELAKANGAPIILMHMQGTPQTMQQSPQYTDVVSDVHAFFVERLRLAAAVDVHDVIIDPGFGFGKTLAHNLALAKHFADFQTLDRPLLAGISRKSMLRKLFEVERGETLPGQSAIHLQLMHAGARILRVHDVAATKQVLRACEVLS